MMDETEFYSELRRRFPELVDEVDDGVSTGLLHLEMGELARLASQAIGSSDRDTLLRCFGFAALALETGSPDLKNAVAVSFLEHTLLRVSSLSEREAEALLPPSLRAELHELREYFAELERRSGSSQEKGAGPRRKERPPNKRMQRTRAGTDKSRRGPPS